MVSDRFVEFLYPEEALKQQEKFSFLIQKYKRNREELRGFKESKIRELGSFLGILEAVEKELLEFRKLLPRPSSAAPRRVVVSAPPKVKKKIKKKKVIKRSVKKRELESLKLGLEKIRDELENM